MMPDNLRYTKDHEWIKIDGDTATIGITDYAQEQLGDITFVDLPQADMEVEAHGELAVIESVKAAVDVYAPVAGKVSEVNEALGEAPEMINKDPCEGGWICKLSGFDAGAVDELMDAAAYESFIESA